MVTPLGAQFIQSRATSFLVALFLGFSIPMEERRLSIRTIVIIIPRILFYGEISLGECLAGRHDKLDWFHATYLVEAEVTSYDTFIEAVGTLAMGRLIFEEIMRSISIVLGLVSVRLSFFLSTLICLR